MRNINFDNLTENVIKAYAGTGDPRKKEILTLLIQRLHDFVRDVNLTPQEWEDAIGMLTRAGDITTPERNEFILLSDLLGVSALVDLVDGREDVGATITTVMGPFYTPGTPELPNGADLTGDNEGERILVHGRISNGDDAGVAGAKIEIWQNGPNGLYTVQDPTQPEHNLRGVLHADDDGKYSFTTAKPVPYTVPDDGPGGELVRAGNRHCWRPAHIHLMISAEGCKRHVTQIYNTHDTYIDEDAVFGVREPLVVDYEQVPTDEEQARFANIKGTWNIANVDFILAPG